MASHGSIVIVVFITQGICQDQSLSNFLQFGWLVMEEFEKVGFRKIQNGRKSKLEVRAKESGGEKKNLVSSTCGEKKY